MSEELDLFYHALNYRGASTQNAELFWRELQNCVNRLIEAEREECAKVCEQQLGFIGECPEMATYCADAIRMRSNAPAPLPIP